MFHIEHRSGAGWTPEGETALHARVAALRVPVLDFSADLREWVQKMRRLNAPAIFNLENWGLGGVDLPERQG
jgi:predicted nucleic acid-binding Zn ribbon protein